MQGLGLAHAIGHTLQLSEAEVVTAMVEKGRESQAFLSRWFGAEMAERGTTFEDFLCSLNVKTGWKEDAMFGMLACMTYMTHIAVLSPKGAWCTTRSGSTKFAAVVVMQCEVDGNVVFEAIVPRPEDRVLFGSELCDIMSTKVQFVRDALMS